MPSHLLFAVSLSIALAGGPGIEGPESLRPPLAVSPGEEDRLTLVERRCPTFSWGTVAGAAGFELAVYRLEDLLPELRADGGNTATEEPARPVWRRLFPGAVSSFTPSLAECFERGERLAWFVRAVRPDEQGGNTGWSAARAFEIAAEPPIDVEQVAAAVRRLEASPAPAQPAGEPPAPGEPLAENDGPSTRGRTALRLDAVRLAQELDVGAASAGLKALSTTAGKHGVIGSAGSTTAAGLVGANTETGGPDLILEGDPDALFTEAGIDVASGSPTTFEIGNSLGSFTLLIDGVAAVTTATDQNTTYNGSFPIIVGGTTVALSPSGCTNGEHWRWTGSSWSCSKAQLACSVESDDFTGASRTTACPLGTVVTGGGFDITDGSAGLNWNGVESRPFGNGWLCSREVFAASTSTCYAVCCSID